MSQYENRDSYPRCRWRMLHYPLAHETFKDLALQGARHQFWLLSRGYPHEARRVGNENGEASSSGPGEVPPSPLRPAHRWDGLCVHGHGE